MSVLSERLSHEVSIFAPLFLSNLERLFTGSLQTDFCYLRPQNSSRLFQQFYASAQNLQTAQRTRFGVYGICHHARHLLQLHLARM